MAVPIWVTEADVIGTWVIGVLALFGDRIRATVFKSACPMGSSSRMFREEPRAGSVSYPSGALI
jgi:hypothetical protein